MWRLVLCAILAATVSAQAASAATPPPLRTEHGAAPAADQRLIRGLTSRIPQWRVIRPVEAPSVVASVAFPGGVARLDLWRTRSGARCLMAVTTTDASLPWGGCRSELPPSLVAYPQCGPICLYAQILGPGSHRLLFGTVEAAAEDIRVVTTSGVAEYPLSGPLLAPADRVFMLDEGGADWRRLLLLRHGKVVASVAQTSLVSATQDCVRAGYVGAALAKCVKKHTLP